MVVQIQIRRDTAANWTSNDPTMAQGELGYETDTTKLKVGDGSTAWTSLGYVDLGQEAIEDIVGAMVGGASVQTRITVTYDDTNGELDFVVDDMTADTQLTSAQVIDMIEAIGVAVPVAGDWFIYSDAGILKRALISAIDEDILTGIKTYVDLRLLIADIDDAPVDGVVNAPISSNWAFDHAASPADVRHLTDAEITALHDIYTNTNAVDAIEAVGVAAPIAADWFIYSDAGVLKRALISGIDENILTAIKTYVDGQSHQDTDWNATTVSQAEAEAGTATTDRKWTAERVKQAIVALESAGYGDSDAVDAIEAVGVATPVAGDWFVYSDAGVLKRALISGINHSILSGLGGKYTAAEAVVDVDVAPAPQFTQAGNGGEIRGHSSHGVAYLPATDADCFFRFNLTIPANYPTPNTVTLEINYFTSTAANYSTKWNVEGWKVGTAWDAQQNNILLNSANDFSGTNKVITVKTIVFNDTDIEAGGTVGILVQSDASNPGYLMILGITLKET